MNKRKTGKMVDRDEVVAWLDNLLDIAAIKDVSRNGLQVQGADRVCRIGLTVDACLEAYQAAAAKGCQLLITHHGLIWGGLEYITGDIYRQVRFLFDHAMNLYAAHLPLDLHPKLGNNAQIAAALGLRTTRPFGDYHGTLIGCEGSLPKSLTLDALCRRLETILGGIAVALPFGKKEVKRAAIVSGSASEIIDEAIQKGVDCYITGEPKHAHHHKAREAGMNVVYCGHYHSEKPGVIAVGKALAEKFGLECTFLDVPTIV